MHRNSISFAAVLLAPLIATSCSSPEPQTSTSSANTHIIDNCGYKVSVNVPVQRATTLEQGATDTLLLLGAKDQIAGYGHQKDAPPKDFDLEGIRELSPGVPNSEQLRDVDTDFIYSPFALSWTADSAGPREEWEKLGVSTYQSNVECPNMGDNVGKSKFDLIERDLTELGTLFGREDAAKELIEKQDRALESATQAPEGTTFMLLYSSIGGAPYVAGGPSVITDIGEASGMTNVFGDLAEEWPQVSWEAVAEANPDVIMLADLPNRGEPGDKWQEKVDALEATPGTKEMEAVKSGKYIVVPGVATSAAGRSYEILEIVSESISDGLFGNEAR